MNDYAEESLGGLEDEADKLVVEQDRGARADRILDDALFKEAMRATRDAAVESFKAAGPLEIEKLQLARLKIEVAEDFLTELVTHLETGEMAQGQLAHVWGRIKVLKEKARGYYAADPL